LKTGKGVNDDQLVDCYGSCWKNSERVTELDLTTQGTRETHHLDSAGSTSWTTLPTAPSPRSTSLPANILPSLVILDIPLDSRGEGWLNAGPGKTTDHRETRPGHYEDGLKV
jgi:hypothetical protein